MHIILWLACWAADAAARNAGPRFGLPPRDANGTTAHVPWPTGTGTNSDGFNTSSYCGLQMAQYFRTYNPTGSYTTSTITDYIGYDDSGKQTGDIVTQYYSTRTITFTEEAYMAYQLGAAKPPCCNTCQMKVGTIEFFWWPGLAANATTRAPQYLSKPANNTSGPVTAVGTNGFIFTSPTVYMAFSSLYAKNFCGTVGDVWSDTTIGFHPNEISTINPYTYTFTNYDTITHSGTTVTAINDTSGTRPPPSPLQYTDLAQNCSTISGYAYFPDDPQNDIMGAYDHDPCHPILAVPTGLITMQQAWMDAHCTVLDGYGAYDPPIALTAAPSADGATLPAQPGSTSTRYAASMTSTYIALPDEKSAALPMPSSQSIDGVSETTWTIPRVTYNIPVVQQTEDTLNVPDAVPTESKTRKYKPHVESSVSELPNAGSGAQPEATHVERPVSSPTSTLDVYTIIEVTTDSAGSSKVLTRTTEAVAQSVKTITEATTQPGGYVVMHTILQVSNEQGNTDQQGEAAGHAYTILRDTTLPNGPTTVVPAVVVLADSETTKLPAPAIAPIITIAGATYTANTASAFDIDGTTLTPGKTLIVSGTTLALAQDGSTVFINGQPVPLSIKQSNATPIITLGNQVATGDTSGHYTIAPGTTLSLGGPSVTLNGTAYALKTNSAGDTLLVAGLATSTRSVNVAGYIMSAIGQMDSSSSKGTSTSHISIQGTTTEETARGSTVSSAVTGIRPVGYGLCFMILVIVMCM